MGDFDNIIELVNSKICYVTIKDPLLVFVAVEVTAVWEVPVTAWAVRL